MKISMRNISKSILFSILFIGIFLGLTQVFKHKLLAKPWDTSIKINGLYNEERNSFDIMFAGTSHMYSSVIPTQLEEETGIKGYTFATSQQPVWLTYYYIEEFLKYQSPKLIVLDVRELALEDEYAEEGPNRTALDHIKFSNTKLKAIQASVPKEDRPSFYLSFIKYHTRWKELKKADFSLDYLKRTDNERGYVRLTGVGKDIKVYDNVDKNDVRPIPKKCLEYLNKIVKLLEDKGIELILIKSPSNPNAEEQRLYNSVRLYSEDNNLTFLNFNDQYEEIGLNIETDFYDQGHLNQEGASKFTVYIGEIITTYWQE